MGVRLLVKLSRTCRKTALTGSFLKRKMQEYELLKQEIESLTQEAQIVKEAEVAEVAAKTSKEDTFNVKAGFNG